MKNIFILLLLSLTPLSSYTLNRPLSTDLISTEPTLQSTESNEMTENQRAFVEIIALFGTFFKDKNQIFIVMPLSLAYGTSLYHQVRYEITQKQPFMQLIAIDAHRSLAVFTPNLHLINAHAFSNTFPFNALDTTPHDSSKKKEVLIMGLQGKSSFFHGITVPYEQWQSPDIIDIHTVNMTLSTTLGEGRPVFSRENNKVIGIQSKIIHKAIQVVSANVVYDLLQQAQNKPLNCPVPWTGCIDTQLESLHNTKDPIIQFQLSELYQYIFHTSAHINKTLSRQFFPTTQNQKISIQFLKKSAEQDYPPAMHLYASYLLQLQLSKTNAQKALRFLQTAAQRLYAPSLFYIGKELVLYTEKKENNTLFQLALGEKIDPNIKEEKRREGLQLIQYASSLNYPPAKDYLNNQDQQ